MVLSVRPEAVIEAGSSIHLFDGPEKAPHPLKELDIMPYADVAEAAPWRARLALSVRTLQAYINGVHVGELRDEKGVWSFSYKRKWVSAADSYALSPGMPLGRERIVDNTTIRPVQRYFDNLLPQTVARAVLAKDAGVDEADVFSLLAYCGAESADYHLGDYPSHLWLIPALRKLAGTAWFR